MHLWGPDREAIPVRWHWCEDDAAVYSRATEWRSVDWLNEGIERIPHGNLGVRGSYYRGKPLVTYKADEVHGPQSAWDDHGLWGSDPALHTDLQGALADCRLDDASLPDEQDATGGQALGGLALVGLGQLVAGGGGQAQGGYALTTPHSFGYGTGGQAQGCDALVGRGRLFAGTGGQAQGGLAAWVPSWPDLDAKGQAQGGDAGIYAGVLRRALDGQKQGGLASYYRGTLRRGTDGQEQGGLATYDTGKLINGAGGPLPLSAGTFTVTFQGTNHAGDLLLFIGEETFLGPAARLPAGFTRVMDKLRASQKYSVVAYKITGASEPASYTISAPGTSGYSAFTFRIRGPITGLFNVAGQTGGTGTFNATAPSAATGAGRGIAIIAYLNNVNTNTGFPTGYTNLAVMTGANPYGNTYWKWTTAAGTTGPATVTISMAATYAAFQITVQIPWSQV